MKRINVGLATRIATEHLSYRSLLDEIEKDLALVRQEEPATFSGLTRLLRSFQAEVRAHFALEEKGGLFEVYEEHAPAMRRQARLMLDQHRVFLARLGRCLATAGRLERLDGPEFRGFSRDLRELIAALRQHEQDEDALLDRLVEHDIRHGRG